LNVSLAGIADDLRRPDRVSVDDRVVTGRYDVLGLGQLAALSREITGLVRERSGRCNVSGPVERASARMDVLAADLARRRVRDDPQTRGKPKAERPKGPVSRTFPWWSVPDSNRRPC
jgi:hypothetical protein